MEKNKIDRVIEAFRNYINLKEDGMVVGTSGFTGSANPKGPVAGFDPLITFGKKKKGDGIDFRRVRPQYRKWIRNK